jgi:transcriptional regulator NrdR family protein
MFICPQCLADDNGVTRTNRVGTIIEHYRICNHCGFRFKTYLQACGAPVPVKARTAAPQNHDLFSEK